MLNRRRQGKKCTQKHDQFGYGMRHCSSIRPCMRRKYSARSVPCGRHGTAAESKRTCVCADPSTTVSCQLQGERCKLPRPPQRLGTSFRPPSATSSFHSLRLRAQSFRGASAARELRVVAESQSSEELLAWKLL